MLAISSPSPDIESAFRRPLWDNRDPARYIVPQEKIFERIFSLDGPSMSPKPPSKKPADDAADPENKETQKYREGCDWRGDSPEPVIDDIVCPPRETASDSKGKTPEPPLVPPAPDVPKPGSPWPHVSIPMPNFPVLHTPVKEPDPVPIPTGNGPEPAAVEPPPDDTLAPPPDERKLSAAGNELLHESILRKIQEGAQKLADAMSELMGHHAANREGPPTATVNETQQDQSTPLTKREEHRLRHAKKKALKEQARREKKAAKTAAKEERHRLRHERKASREKQRRRHKAEKLAKKDQASQARHGGDDGCSDVREIPCPICANARRSKSPRGMFQSSRQIDGPVRESWCDVM
ncbi:hypothetical protein F5Y15DRAFT_225168 [Xylariaceae sp. FL0016]|nr:hypothetical protein F5Y15DRAFT_225168 [Xylariaceae sp. FL0016]